MKITVIGSGNMGSAFVQQLTKAGHQVIVTGRDAAKASQLAARYGARAAAAADAATGSELIVLATAYPDAVSALRAVAPGAGQVVVDITNPLTDDYMGLTLGHTTSAAEEIARAVPNVQIVKAFNTVFAQVLAAGADFGDGKKVATFIAGDDAKAKETVETMARSMGFDVIDAGALKNARYLEPLAGLNIYLGYGAGLGTSIAPTWLRKA
ncbi:NADPH-dependent F420 reductase [Thiomonas sp. FB-Cd]|uniref:NADPH-dependent F420 reductase n=1 Tax=Thiomonas sp. FB-Cd TaxID=1158292 RepID=UPI0004DFB664|nr:NAD(P)-binding domain-containing protein [Thiomonas sp. FB-Cd]